MTNRSVFPNAVDSFNYLSEILASDKNNVERYKILLMQESRTPEEETELSNLKATLYNAGKIVTSESFNKIFDCMTNLENFFLNETIPYLNSLEVGSLRSDLDTHTNNINDPHQSYKQSVDWVKNYGLGTDATIISNANTITVTGFYQTTSSTQNVPTTNGGTLTHIARSGRPTQTYQDYNTNLVYTRSYSSTGWTVWAKLVNLSSAGIMTLPNQSYVYAYKSVGAAISSGVATRMVIDTINTDRQSEFSSSIYTAKEAGLYLVVMQSTWATAPSSDTYHYIYKNGSQATSDVVGAGEKYPNNARSIILNDGDKLEFYVLQNSGGTSQTLTSFNVQIMKIA